MFCGGTRYVFFLFHNSMISTFGKRDSRERRVVNSEERCVHNIDAKELIILINFSELKSEWPCWMRLRYWL
jgi:hypothetical protein